MTLKRDVQMPLYQQMANEIKAQIASGELRQNEQIMTEMELSREFGVSRITVRKALELLVEEDILSKRQGVGAFVTGKKLVRSMNVMMGFTQTCEANGQNATSRLLFAGLNEARPADIKLLGVKEGDSVISLKRLRFCDNVPVMVEEVRLQRSFAYLLGEDLTGSLHKMLAENGIKVVKGVKTISISSATKEESSLLGMGEGAALLLQRDVSYDENGQAVYRSKSVINADRYTCTITMQA